MIFLHIQKSPYPIVYNIRLKWTPFITIVNKYLGNLVQSNISWLRQKQIQISFGLLMNWIHAQPKLSFQNFDIW